ncbi:MAG: TetR/AcrR family transcriptional regulator [Burkholderiaceae bacterium]|jgi:AcrR family transcriptional regulator
MKMADARLTPPKQRADRDLLDRGAWLRAASDAVAEGGFANLRILVLAKRLGVTRGSFYWHFRDHADLVAAFLDHWLAFRRHRMETWQRLITEDDPKAALLHSLDINFDEGRNSYRNIRIELAIRDLARQNEYAAAVLRQSDEMRHARSVELYTRLTGDPVRSRLLAITTYLIVAGADLILQGPSRDEATVKGIHDLVAELLISAQARAPVNEN